MLYSGAKGTVTPNNRLQRPTPPNRNVDVCFQAAGQRLLSGI